MRDLVSVIVPTYNRSFDMLDKAIQSILCQSHSNFEIIIVDDNYKNSEFRKDIEKNINVIQDKRVRYIQHLTNQGACAARNTGVKHSSGEYYAFLDDDDEWLEDKLKLQLKKIKASNSGMVYCPFDIYTYHNQEVVKKNTHRILKSGWIFEDLIINNFIGSTSLVLINKDVFHAVGGFNIELKSAQDYELWLRIAKKFTINYVDKPLVKYHKHEGERISTNPDNKINGFEKVIEYNFEYLTGNPKVLAIRKLKILPYYIKKYGRRHALVKLLEIAKLHPFSLKVPVNFIKILLNYSD